MTKPLRENPMAEILPLLSGDLQNLQIFFDSGTKHVLKKDSTIISQGNMVDRIYFLNKGKLKVTVLTDSGDEKLFWYAYPYSIFGEVPFFCKMPCNGTITTEEDSEFTSHDYDNFFRILYKNPAAMEYFLIIMSKKIQILTGQVRDVSCNSPKIRISKLIYSMAKQFGKNCCEGIELNLTVTYKEIAFLTGLHRVTVTNVVNNLKKDGIIIVPKRGQLIVSNIDKLYTNAFYVNF